MLVSPTLPAVESVFAVIPAWPITLQKSVRSRPELTPPDAMPPFGRRPVNEMSMPL